MNRSISPSTEAEVRRWLGVGPNWIMVELENSRWGACTASVEFLANENQLEGSPYFIPHAEQATLICPPKGCARALPISHGKRATRTNLA